MYLQNFCKADQRIPSSPFEVYTDFLTFMNFLTLFEEAAKNLQQSYKWHLQAVSVSVYILHENVLNEFKSDALSKLSRG